MIQDAELVQIAFQKILHTRAYTVVILGHQEKSFAIYLDPQIGKVMQLFLTEQERQRPLSHDLINSCFTGMGVRVKQVVITDIQDTIYFARLFLEQQLGSIRHILEIDSRPSDALTLALLNHVPVYCTKHVLEESLPVEE